MLRKFTTFVCVGGIATAFQYVILFLLVELGSFSPVLSSTIGFMLSCILNYSLNYRYTFRSDKKHSEAFSRFMIVASIGLSLNAAVMYFFVNVAGFVYILSQVLATIVVLMWNFLANSLWSFKKSRSNRIS